MTCTVEIALLNKLMISQSEMKIFLQKTRVGTLWG